LYASAWPFDWRSTRFDLRVAVPKERRKRSFVFIEEESGDRRQRGEPLAGSAHQAQLILYRTGLQDLDSRILNHVRQRLPVAGKSRDRGRQNVHYRTIQAGGNVDVRHFAGKQASIKKNVVFDRQFVRPFGSGVEFHFYFEPAPRPGTELADPEIRGRDEIFIDLADLKFT